MAFDFENLTGSIPVELIDIPLFAAFAPRIYLLRLDALRLGSNGALMGNKIFKLLPSIRRAQALYESVKPESKQSDSRRSEPQIISFGGPWSNHLHALAAAGQAYAIKTVGIVRGERRPQLTAMLAEARQLGMRLQFVSRDQYQRLQQAESVTLLNDQFGEGIIVPVGGSNLDGLLGATAMGLAIAQNLPPDVDDIWLASATGGTAAGMIAGASQYLRLQDNDYSPPDITAVNVLRHCDMAHDIAGFLRQIENAETDKLCEKGTVSQPWRVLDGYHCGGYARVNKALLAFHQQLECELNQVVDQVYMAKLLFALWCCLNDGKLAQHKAIAVVHSGGQQGRRGLVNH